MDHFEGIVGMLLEAEGYWVRRSFKVNVTPEEKRAIGKHSIPRNRCKPRPNGDMRMMRR